MCGYNVAFVINRNYIGQFKVTFNSLAKSNPEKAFKVHLMHSDLNEADIADLRRFTSERGSEITFYLIDESVFSSLPKMSYDNTYTAYYKVLLPYYLKDCDRALFLDCDIIVRGDVAPLFMDNGAFLTAAVDYKINKKRREHVQKITGNSDATYFNSGVMAFDFSKSQSIVPIEQVVAYIGENAEKIRWHDQDILNHFYSDSFAVMDEKYNYLTTYKTIADGIFRFGSRKAVIAHYANWKPWNADYIGKLYRLYKKNYLALSGESGVNFLKKRRLSAQCKLLLKYLKRKGK